MKRVAWIVKPLPCKEEISEIRDRLSGRLGDVVADGLGSTIVVGKRETRASPRFATHSKSPQSILFNVERARRVDCDASYFAVVLDEETSVNVHRQYVTGNSDRDGPVILREVRFDLPNLIGQQKLDAISFRRAWSECCRRWWIPRNDATPLIFGKRACMGHPREHAFECLTRPRRFAQWLI